MTRKTQAGEGRKTGMAAVVSGKDCRAARNALQKKRDWPDFISDLMRRLPSLAKML
jgi:hypothetical protein